MIFTHPELITVKEAAALLRYDEDTVWRKIRRGEIPGVHHHGRSIRIDRTALFALPPAPVDESGRV